MDTNSQVPTQLQSSDSESTIQYLEFSPERCNPQISCPLFTVLPPELREHIFAYALADYEDTSALYPFETCYRRPNYFAPRRSDTALLRTCQRIYRETWFLPCINAEHTFYLTANDRQPEHAASIKKIKPTLELLHTVHAPERIELNHVRIFPQMYIFEDGQNLRKILDIPHFHPRCITVTIRHTDWWNWESDQPLFFSAEWLRTSRFPESLREFRIELESLERRKDQIDDMAQQMAEGWKIQRHDGTLMVADTAAPTLTLQWSGSSIWGGERWVRDETNTPERLEYYIRTVTWRPSKPAIETNGTAASTQPQDLQTRVFSAPFSRSEPRLATLTTLELSRALVPPGTPAVEAAAMLAECVRKRNEARREANRQQMRRRRPSQGQDPPVLTPRTLRYMTRVQRGQDGG